MNKKVLVLIDWDNLFLCLYNRFKIKMNLEYRIQKLLEWVQKEIGEILEGHGFVFAPEHLSYYHQKICEKYSLQLVTCPKKQVKDAFGKVVKEQDTVDDTLIWFGKMMFRHPDVKFICLVAGDDDYVPLLEEAQRQGVHVALVPPTIDSLSRSKNLLGLVGKHPKTLKKMLLRLDTLQ